MSLPIHDPQTEILDRQEVDRSLEAVDLVRDDVKFAVQSEAALGLAPSELVASCVKNVIVVPDCGQGDESEGERFQKLDEESVGADVRDDRSEDGFLLLFGLPLKEFEELDLHALALGVRAVDLGDREML